MTERSSRSGAWAACSTLARESRAFVGVNRSKRGVVLDLKQRADREVLLRLVRDADVLVHNFRPGVPERLGIAYAQLQPLNDRLIYCAVTGFGETGPLKDKAGYDQVLQTYSGMCDEQGQRGGPPEILYGSVVDYFASAMVASGVASALYEREKSGRGQQVGVSLLRAALTMQSARLVWAEDEPRDVSRDMRSGGITAVIVEHDMDVVFTYCPRIVAMHQGAILADGTPEQIRNNAQVTANMLGTTG